MTMAWIDVNSKLWIISAVCFMLLPDAVRSLCPSPQWLERANSCYYLSHFSLNFEDAKNECQELGGYLVHVRNAEENRFLQELCTSYEIVPCEKDWEIWLGLYRNTPCNGCSLNDRRMNWYWVDLHKPLVWANWLDRSVGYSEPTEPEQCSRVWIDGGKWGSKHCSSKLMFVCEVESFTTTSSTTTQTTTTITTTTEVVTTAIFNTTTSGSEPITNDSITATSTIQYYPQYGEDTQTDSAETVGFVIGCLFALLVIGCIVGFVVWKYRKRWYKVKLDQGLYFQPMDMERNGAGPCVAMDTEEGATGLQPHYEDDALNIYETIPLDEMKDNRANVSKLKDRSPSFDNLVADASQPSTSRRHSNEYVIPEDMYSTVL